MKLSKVSIIITTRNEEKNIENCLKSIISQTYSSVEVIVVDNNSSDNTKKIAKKFTTNIYNYGPERSAQRNFGGNKATGEYLLFLDADMVLDSQVVEKCMTEINNSKVGGIIIPEESYGNGYWAQVKKLERKFYVGVSYIEAARFFKREVFLSLKGFDERITGPEDWDFSQRVLSKFGLGRINTYIFHNEGKLSFKRTVSKKYYYSKKMSRYMSKKNNKSYVEKQLNIVDRYLLFLRKPRLLFSNPVLGLSVLVLKAAEFAAAGVGFLIGKYGSDI